MLQMLEQPPTEVAILTAARAVRAVLEPSPQHSHLETYNGPESSTGRSIVTKGSLIQLSLLANARTAQSAGNFAEAAANYKRATGLEPGMPQLWANLGLMEHQNGNYTEAISSFLHANRLDSSLYVPKLFLGIDYAHTGKG